MLVLFSQSLSLFFVICEFADQYSNFPLEFSEFSRVAMLELVHILLILIIFMREVAAMGFVFNGSLLVVIVV